jgi:hypothetical protein
MPAWDKLRVGVRRNPKPSVACIGLEALHRLHVLLLGCDEAPNLIDLEALALEALKDAVLIPSSRLPSVHNKLRDRRLAKAGYARDGANAHAFAEQLESLGTFLWGQPVHTDPYT